MKLTDQFSLSKDKYQWILTRHWIGEAKKDKSPVECSKDSYHPNLESVARHMLEHHCESAEDVQELAALFKKGVKILSEAIEKNLQE